MVARRSRRRPRLPLAYELADLERRRELATQYAGMRPGMAYGTLTGSEHEALVRRIAGLQRQMPRDAGTVVPGAAPRAVPGEGADWAQAGELPPWLQWTEPLEEHFFQREMAQVSADLGRRGVLDSSMMAHATAGASARAQELAWRYGRDWAQFERQTALQDWQMREAEAQRRLQGWQAMRQASLQGRRLDIAEQQFQDQLQQQWDQFSESLDQQTWSKFATEIAKGYGPEPPPMSEWQEATVERAKGYGRELPVMTPRQEFMAASEALRETGW